ncbi:GFA family protein [Enterococcus faecalis]|uniref:GFA family protein n=1 Tax=Enterococcus faecalis TaxID=1351 RepID=UPI002DBA5A45|nr:GFA family protein [Enterococcus faecalis]MEB7792173.1 GFA family protein [Enterococcus faecalis]MEB7810183.1 GFA family protein [Enterococcus faecalis]
MIRGNCLCKGIEFDINFLEGPLIHCHCNFCRRTHSSAFSSNMTCNTENFILLKGDEYIRYYESSIGKKRYFCSQCGTSLWHTKEAMPDRMTIKMGTIEEFDDFNAKNIESFHINCASDKIWLSYENLKKYSELKG